MTKLEKKQLDLIRIMPLTLSSIKSKNLTIKDLKMNSFLKYQNQTLFIEDIATYLEVKWKNFKPKKEDYIVTEFKCFSLITGETIYIEWEEDDEIEAFITTEVIRLNNIKCNDKNINNALLEYLAEEEEGIVEFNNNKYEYIENDTWAALYNSKKYTDNKVRLYEFSNINNDDDFLTIEVWEDEDDKPEKEAFLSKKLNLKDIKILSLS